MTTTQPAALPECIAHVEDWPDDRTPIGLVWDVDPKSVPVGTKLYALAALQLQPAEVSDVELRKTIDALRDPGTVSAFYNGYYTLTPDELRRAILALRPQAVPIGRDDLKALMSAAGYVHATAQEKADFINGFRHAEQHHRIGITQRADGGEG